MAKKHAAPPPELPTATAIGDVLMEVPLELILPNPEQPRQQFDAHELNGLAQSIAENGVLQPVTLEAAGNGMYILHAGERRTRAARIAGLKTIPAMIRPSLNGHGQETRLVNALVENLQRTDMGPIEEARGFQRLLEMGHTKTAIGQKLGISCARVTSRLELLELEPEIQGLVESGALTKDKRLMDALREIPDSSSRVKMAKSLATRNASIKAGLEACRKLTSVLAADTIADDVPAMHLARKKASFSRPKWDAFAQVGKVPPWPLMEICVRDTCEKCSLRDVASAKTCNGCAMVDLLRQMIGSAQ
jgi:ParB family chromosome partitioning protein